MPSVDPMEGLSSENHEQIVKYLKFMKGKREHVVSCVGGDFDDTKDSRLHEEMYAKDDVEDMLDTLMSTVQDNVKQEVQTIISMNVLLMKQLMTGANEQGADVSINTSVVDDADLLESVDKMKLDAPLPSARAEAKPDRRPVGLASFKDDQESLVAAKVKLENDNATLQARFTQMQSQMSAVLKDKSKISDELEETRRALSLTRNDAAAQSKDASDTIDRERGDKASLASASASSSAELSSALAESRSKVDRLEADLDAKLTSSSQFVQMKKLMSSKTEQVKDLRRRLQRFEPDTLEDED